MIYLCGFMGSGKSFLGKKASLLLNLRYADLDILIENNLNLSIPEIFNLHGQNFFREQEYYALTNANNYDIISLGGGTLTHTNSYNFIKRSGKIIFIKTAFEICYRRIENDSNRPNAIGKTYDELYKLYNTRLQIYETGADYTVTNENEFIDIVKDLIC